MERCASHSSATPAFWSDGWHPDVRVGAATLVRRSRGLVKLVQRRKGNAGESTDADAPGSLRWPESVGVPRSRDADDDLAIKTRVGARSAVERVVAGPA